MPLLSKQSQHRKGWIVQETDRSSFPSKPRPWEAFTVAMLAVAALMVAGTLMAGGAALAGPLLQDSPLAPPPEQLSPLPTAAPSVESAAPATTPALQPQPTAAATAEPPLPMAALIGVMLVIGLIALVVGLRRR
jgi:hypothetical protein